MTAEAWLRFLAAAEPGSTVWPHAVRAAGCPDRILGMRAGALSAIGLTAKSRRKLRSPATEKLRTWRDWLDDPTHGLITLGSAAYPARLAELPDAPVALWVRGRDPSLLSQPQLAIVGSRRPSAGGRLTAQRFARAVSECGITVTSGLAVGIDAAGHDGALAGLAGTVAVLGSGIDRVYPRCNGDLASRIESNHLIVSEYAPGTATRAFHFPCRNRIIAALSLGTLVVEAGRKSGSLITARRAAEFGREVFAIPGSIHSSLSKGCHQLLREGAKLVECIDDILVEIAPGLHHMLEEPADDAIDESPNLDGTHRKLLKSLDFTPVTIDDLVEVTGLTAAELSSMLLHLEMRGTVEALPGGRYCRLVKRS